MASDETPVERLLFDTAKRMRRIFDAEPEANAIDCGREAIRLLRALIPVVRAGDACMDRSCGCDFAKTTDDAMALLARCTEGPR